MAELLTPGRLWQRVAFVVLLPAALFAGRAWWGGHFPGLGLLGLSVLTFMAAVLSSAAIFRAWTQFGERLNRVVVGVVFGAIYFVVVPFFLFVTIRDMLGVRHPERRASFWRERPYEEESVERMVRMG